MKTALANASILSALAFSNAAPAAGKTTDTKAPVDAGKPAAAAKTDKPKTEFTLAEVRTDVAIPEKKNKRGSVSKFPFDSLAVGGSFGIKGRTAKDMGSTVSNANRKYAEPKKDENGGIVYKQADIKDAGGNVTGRIPTSDPETVRTRNYFVVDTDPKTDPDGANCRVFRDK